MATIASAKVSSKKNQFGEWLVHFYDIDGKEIKEALYHTTDLEDAQRTASNAFRDFANNQIKLHAKMLLQDAKEGLDENLEEHVAQGGDPADCAVDSLSIKSFCKELLSAYCDEVLEEVQKLLGPDPM